MEPKISKAVIRVASCSWLAHAAETDDDRKSRGSSGSMICSSFWTPTFPEDEEKNNLSSVVGYYDFNFILERDVFFLLWKVTRSQVEFIGA